MDNEVDDGQEAIEAEIPVGESFRFDPHALPQVRLAAKLPLR
jgi:hypothetical protein